MGWRVVSCVVRRRRFRFGISDFGCRFNAFKLLSGVVETGGGADGGTATAAAADVDWELSYCCCCRSGISIGRLISCTPSCGIVV